VLLTVIGVVFKRRRAGLRRRAAFVRHRHRWTAVPPTSRFVAISLSAV
jgi:hypothetical protein